MRYFLLLLLLCCSPPRYIATFKETRLVEEGEITSFYKKYVETCEVGKTGYATTGKYRYVITKCEKEEN